MESATVSGADGPTHGDARWTLERFDELNLARLYAILSARVAVFVVEQNCPYQELDGHDPEGLHLAGWLDGASLAAYARILPPGSRFAEPSIGRVLTTRAVRGRGWGRRLMRRAVAVTRQKFPAMPVRLSAQCHLQRFYAELGFRIDSRPYQEDGIDHVDMVLDAA